jgi:hypothetical protein
MGGDEMYCCTAYWYHFIEQVALNNNTPTDNSLWIAIDLFDCIGGN